MGRAISKIVAIVEIIKERIPRLYQDTAISSMSITDVWEPIEEGLVPVEMTRHVSIISITLSTKELNKDLIGYQAPHYAEQPKPQYHYQQQQPPKQDHIPYNAVNEGDIRNKYLVLQLFSRNFVLLSLNSCPAFHF